MLWSTNTNDIIRKKNTIQTPAVRVMTDLLHNPDPQPKNIENYNNWIIRLLDIFMCILVTRAPNTPLSSTVMQWTQASKTDMSLSPAATWARPAKCSLCD